jgi:phage shock protein E
MLFKRSRACHSMPMSKAAEELMKDESIQVLDVRTYDEYRRGHIPGSMNLPMDQASEIIRLVPNKDTRLFVYCQSGARSQRACEQFAGLGYSDVTNIRGIAQWKGDIERGANA